MLDNGDLFRSVTNIGDFDSDGVTDLAVGADSDDDGGTNRGAVYIVLLNADSMYSGTTLSLKKGERTSATGGSAMGACCQAANL